ncbi:MAG TPA: N-acetylmuramoyl-L-alanine amidase [Stellaceae bacterium]|jgi:N-acetylmuramoyl-L-alanine amidase|nr:N-acetylmuramoyl-L-alanine amidase [Stellaceae bacterium]
MTLSPRERASPNHDERRQGPPDMLILHYTGMISAAAALDRLCDPAARVSSHYVVDEDGAVWRLVPEERRAWHAGESGWLGRRDINAHSIGIEIVNPGHEFGYRPFPEAQLRAVETLCRDIATRWTIPPRLVVGHSDVAPHRKQDPGELFPWRRLAEAGIGLWPDFSRRPDRMPESVGQIQAALAAYGYDLPATGTLDGRTVPVLTAFQRHFRPTLCDGIADDETRRRIALLAAAV